MRTWPHARAAASWWQRCRPWPQTEGAPAAAVVPFTPRPNGRWKVIVGAMGAVAASVLIWVAVRDGSPSPDTTSAANRAVREPGRRNGRQRRVASSPRRRGGRRAPTRCCRVRTWRLKRNTGRDNRAAAGSGRAASRGEARAREHCARRRSRVRASAKPSPAPVEPPAAGHSHSRHRRHQRQCQCYLRRRPRHRLRGSWSRALVNGQPDRRSRRSTSTSPASEPADPNKSSETSSRSRRSSRSSSSARTCRMAEGQDSAHWPIAVAQAAQDVEAGGGGGGAALRREPPA